MSTHSTLFAAENSCWSDWIQAVKTQQPGLYFVAGLTGTGKRTVLDLTRSLLADDGVRTVDGAGIVEIDGMLKGMVVVHGEVCDVTGLQRAVDLAAVGAVVLCSIHAYEVKHALQRLGSSIFGASFHVVGPFLRAVMVQMLVPKASDGRTCINELSVFGTFMDVQTALRNGPIRTLRNDAEAKIATGILTVESAEQAGVLDR